MYYRYCALRGNDSILSQLSGINEARLMDEAK